MEKEIIGALYQTNDIDECELLSDILINLSDCFHKLKATNFKGSFNFIIGCSNKDVNFTIRIDNDNFKILTDYSDTNPFLTIKCNFETFCNITRGKFNPVIDILRGKIKLDNGIFSISRFAKFGSFFSLRDIDLSAFPLIKHSDNWIKPQKILLINGSPRKNGSTNLMLKWFCEGLPENLVEVINVSSLKISKCLHCFKCWTVHPNICVINDDANIFRQKIDEADLIVFFVPLSFFTMPSDMKRAFERLFPETSPFFYHNNQFNATAHPTHNNKKPQAFMQFLVWGFPELKYGKILEQNFITWSSLTQKKYLGSLNRAGINMILGDPRMQFIRKRIKQAIIETAKTVYEQGVIPIDKKKIIENVDYYTIKDFHFYATNYWIKRFKTDYWNLKT